MAQVSLFSLSSPFPASAVSSRLRLNRPLPFQFSRIQASSDATSASASNSNAKVVVTRERGKNGKLIKALVRVLFSRTPFNFVVSSAISFYNLIHCRHFLFLETVRAQKVSVSIFVALDLSAQEYSSFRCFQDFFAFCSAHFRIWIEDSFLAWGVWSNAEMNVAYIIVTFVLFFFCHFFWFNNITWKICENKESLNIYFRWWNFQESICCSQCGEI